MAKTAEQIKADMAALRAKAGQVSKPGPGDNGAAKPTADRRHVEEEPRGFHEEQKQRPTGREIVPVQRARQAQPSVTKELPHSLEAEQGILGCMIRAPAFSVPIVTQRIGPNHFYSANHQLIFADLVNAVADLGLEGAQSLDLVVLEDYFKGVGHLEKIGGPVTLRSLFVDAADPAILTHHIDILVERHQRRELIQSTSDIARRAADEREDIGALALVARERAEWVGTLSVARKTGLTVRTLSELVGMTFDEKDNYFGDRIVAAGQACTLLGPGGIGKSRLSMQFAVCMITGRDFLEMPTRGRGMKWLFVQTENNNRRLHFDLKNMVAALALTPEEVVEVDRLLFIHTLENDLDSFLNLINPENYAAIHSLIQDVKPKFIEWDPLNSLTDNDLNSDMDMRAVVSQISRITRHGDPDRVPLVLHHSLTGKVGAARAVGWDKASYGRNSKVLQAWTRAQINLAPRSPDDTDLLIMSCGKNNNGKAFPEIGVKFDPDKGIYLKDDSFDAAEFREDVGIINTVGQFKAKYTKEMILAELSLLEGVRPAALKKMMDDRHGMSKTKFYLFARQLNDARLIEERDGLWFKKGKKNL
jgi:hypothetical protein